MPADSLHNVAVHVPSPDPSSGSVFARLCVFATTRVFATTHVFARRVFGKCLRTPMCLCNDTCLRLACLREVSSPSHVSSRRRASSPDLSSGSVFALPRVFTTTPVFARPVFGKCLHPPMCLRFGKCLRDDTCLRDDACLCQTCLREVSSPSHVCSRRRLSSPDLSSGRVFARPHVFATTRALARPVFGKCLLGRSWLHFWTGLGKDSALGRCLREDVSSRRHVVRHVSSPGMCLQTPTCLRCLRLACVC